MGIPGLLPLLKSISRKSHLEEYAGMKIAVDAYSWLHKASYRNFFRPGTELSDNGYVAYFKSKIKLFEYYRIKPLLVFDGDRLPIKENKEREREDRREKNRRLMNAAIAQGNKTLASQYAVKCMDITPEIAYSCIRYLKEEGIEFIVAPYEADAQMAYLSFSGYVEALVTEDSDMIVFGCQRILYKLQEDGSVLEISAKDIQKSQEIDLSHFDQIKFRQMCILAGCDYIDPLPGIGIKTAHKYFIRYGNISNVIGAIRNSQTPIPDDYEVRFKMAEATFLHQRVYDPVTGKTLHLVPIEKIKNGMCLDFLGKEQDVQTTSKISKGEICPITFKSFEPSILPTSYVQNRKRLTIKRTPFCIIEEKKNKRRVCKTQEEAEDMSGCENLVSSPYFNKKKS